MRRFVARLLHGLADRVDRAPQVRYSINVVHAEDIQPDVRRITYDLQRQMGT